MPAAAPIQSHAPTVSEPAPAHTVKQALCDDICRSGEAFAVSNNRLSSAPDLRRELSIQQRGRDIERYEAARVEANNRNPHTFTDICDAGIARGNADMARRDMERLIRQRSPEQRARMQAAQALRMATEPGAPKEPT